MYSMKREVVARVLFHILLTVSYVGIFGILSIPLSYVPYFFLVVFLLIYPMITIMAVGFFDEFSNRWSAYLILTLFHLLLFALGGMRFESDISYIALIFLIPANLMYLILRLIYKRRKTKTAVEYGNP